MGSFSASNKPSKNPLVFRLVALGIIVLLATPLLLYFGVVSLFHSLTTSHASSIQQLQTNKDALVEQFNQMNVVPSETNVLADDAAIDTSSGESNLLGIPTIKATKHYAFNQTAGKIYDGFDSVLKNNDYTSSTSPTPQEMPCMNGINNTYRDTYDYQKGTSLISIYLVCLSATSDASAWRDIPVTELDESLSISAY